MKDIKEENPLSEIVEDAGWLESDASELEIEQDEIVSETPVFEEVTSSEVPFVEPLGSGQCPVCHLINLELRAGDHVTCSNCSRRVVLL